MDDLLQNHKKELKSLQIEIQKLKKSVAKGDKKRLKEVQLTISNLEKETLERQKKEIDDFELSNFIQEVILPETENEIKIEKPKRRKKKNNVKLYEEIIKNHEANELNSDSHKELEIIKKKLTDRDLLFIDIPADGNCLFNAIGYQCIRHKILDFSTEFSKSEDASLYLRELVYKELMKKQEFYSAFISDEDSSEFSTYCEQIRSTRAWGGQLEINALSEVLECSIEVIQAYAPSIIIGAFNNKPQLIITYHKFAYGLGEHYNTCNLINNEK